MDKFSELSCCVIMPTYNNGQTLEAVIRGVLDYTDKLIVVNDGSTDDTLIVLKKFPDIDVISYSDNKGKGFALKKGFKRAIERGFSYAITIDSDGQHKAKELPVFLNALEENNEALVIGTRNFKGIENMPSKNNFANNFSNFWFRFQTGIRLSDTQSGFRLYPLQLFENHKYISSKYEFELEVLVRAAWQGVPIVSIPIEVYYPPIKERVSHFRPFWDFSRISVLNFVLTTLAIVFFKPRHIIRKYKKKKIKDIIKHDIIGRKTSHKVVAGSVGFGVFMGIVPIWGYQLIVGFALAHLMKLNKAIFFVAANISIPPFIPFILYLSYVTGSYVIGEGSWSIDFELNLENIKLHIKQYLVGSVVLAFMAGIFTGSLTYLLLPLIKKFRRK